MASENFINIISWAIFCLCAAIIAWSKSTELDTIRSFIFFIFLSVSYIAFMRDNSLGSK